MTGSATSRVAPPLLKDLLRDVSRSFYLTLRVLPKSIRDQIGLAYLLARATDTIADTAALPVDQRTDALLALRSCILSERAEPVALPDLRLYQSSDAEKALLERINEAVRLLFEFAPDDRLLIQKVLAIISEGQRLDLERFGDASASNIAALSSDAELDDYTHRVAGCVGEFWTRICVAHLNPAPRIDLETLVAHGIRFGKGLQLVNILRDLPSDLHNGRCYLPWPGLQLVGLRPADLLDKSNEARLRPVYDEWLNTAQEHLTVAWQYVQNLPKSWLRVRLACAWPVLIGIQTLGRLRTANVLDSDTRVKVSRREVKRMICETIFMYPFPPLWERLPERSGKRPV